MHVAREWKETNISNAQHSKLPENISVRFSFNRGARRALFITCNFIINLFYSNAI